MIADCQVEVYSIDGGTTFEWGYKDGNLYGIGGSGYTDAALAWEAAWLRLGNLGGGKGRLRGPGETWTVATQVNSQGDNVEWHSDRSLVIKAPAALNDNLIENTHDNVFLFGIHGNGSKATQTAGTSNAVIMAASCTNFKAIRCKCVDGYQYGIATWNVTWLELAFNHCTGNRWNGMNIGAGAAGSSHINVHHNEVEESSDVGIAFTSNVSHFICSENIIWNIDNTEGFGDGHSGFTCEGRTDGAPAHGVFSDNEVGGCPGAGILFTRIDGATIITDILVDGLVVEDGGLGMSVGYTSDSKIKGIKGTSLTGQVVKVFANCEGNIELSDINGDTIGSHGVEILEDGTTLSKVKMVTVTGHAVYINAADDVAVSIVDLNGGTHGVLIESSNGSSVKGGTIKNMSNAVKIGGVGGDDTVLDGLTLLSSTIGINQDDGEDVCVINNRIKCTTGLDINDADAVSTWVNNNNFEGCTTDVSAAAATTPMYGSNVDQNGARVADGVPV